MTKNIFDITIIGAGIVGMATAYHLLQKKPNLKVLVLEKETSVAFHQSDKNSGVIHSGIYYEPGSAKAINCKKGYGELLNFCDLHHVAYDLCGKVIVATAESELETLTKIFERGKQNGLSNLRLIDANEVSQIEPYVKCIKGIHVPQAGIIDYKEVTEKLAELFIEKGGKLALSRKVQSIEHNSDTITISCQKEKYVTKFLLNCAGLYADKVAEMTGMHADFKIVPFRGEFYKLKDHATRLVNGLIYPVPDMNFPFLGVHFTKRIHGGIEAGPNAVLAFRREGYKHLDVNFSELIESVTYSGFMHLAAKNWKKGMGEMYRSFSPKAFVKALQKMIPSISLNDVERSRSGVRAQALDKKGNLVHDYFFLENERIINLCNAPSPAATSSLSIGDMLSDKIIQKTLLLQRF